MRDVNKRVVRCDFCSHRGPPEEEWGIMRTSPLPNARLYDICGRCISDREAARGVVAGGDLPGLTRRT